MESISTIQLVQGWAIMSFAAQNCSRFQGPTPIVLVVSAQTQTF